MNTVLRELFDSIVLLFSGDPGKCDIYGNTALHWSATNGHFNCVSFLVSFGANLWALDNNYHTAKELAAIQNREDVVQFLDHVIAKQSALNTKVVQKLKEKALSEAEKRIKSFQKLQHKTAKQAEKEEKERERNLKKNLCVLNSPQEAIYSDTEPHIYDTPISVKSLAGSYHSTLSSNGSTKKFSDLVNSCVKNSKTGTTRIRILSGVSKKVLLRKQNSTDTMKSADGLNNNTCRSFQSLVGIRRDDQIVYVPKFNSLSVSNLAMALEESDSSSSNKSGKHLSNSRLHLKDVFNYEILNKNEPKPSTFNKNIKSTIKSKILKFNKTNGSGGGGNKNKSSLYRTVSEPDFLSLAPDNGLQSPAASTVATTFPAMETSSIFERPGFGSVSFRGNFTPELMFSMSRYYPDSIGNSEDDGDSGHDHSQGSSHCSSINKKYLPSKVLCKSNSPDRDSFASDSIGSAGSLVQQDCLEDHYDVEDKEDDENHDCSAQSKSIPVLLFLYAHGLKEYYDIFECEKIDIDALMLLTEEDLVSLGIPLGPRRKLMNAIHQRKHLFESNGHAFETKL